MRRTRKIRFALSLLVMVVSVVSAQQNLSLQIEEITEQIESGESTNPALYLERAELYRRLQDWGRAEADIAAARLAGAHQIDVEWAKGRLLVDAGQLEAGIDMLTRLLEAEPDHARAHHYRGLARWRQGDPAGAADDFARAIHYMPHPAQELFRALVIARFAAGHTEEALIGAEAGLGRFSHDLALLGLAVDLALAVGEDDRARRWLTHVPKPSVNKGEWRYRTSLAACVGGELEYARSGFVTLQAEPVVSQPAPWWRSEEELSSLALAPDADSCRAAADRLMRTRQP